MAKEIKNNKRETGLTGLFFGSFNPPHIGHLAIANYLAEHTALKEIWFVVTPQNPLKKKESLLDDRTRLELVRLAVDDDPRFRVSDIEFSLPQPSYTINTLVYLREKHPERNFALIMGADNLTSIHKWKNYDIIIREYPIFVYPRPNYLIPTLHQGNIVVTEAPLMEISSSFIRESIRNEKDPKFFLPKAVYEYIISMNLYK